MPGLGVPGPGGVPGGDPQIATAAGGMHPTGMHSCLVTVFILVSYLNCSLELDYKNGKNKAFHLKPRPDVTRSPKHGCNWPHKKD